jgi:catalase
MPVGKMVLDRNPENFFTEVEQGSRYEFSDDKLLQGRTFSYVDTQRYRLGANFHELPTNRPLAYVANNQRDGLMQFEVFKGSVLKACVLIDTLIKRRLSNIRSTCIA